MCIPSPTWYKVAFLGYPIVIMIQLISLIPWTIVICEMVITSYKEHWDGGRLENIFDVIKWWTTPYRLAFFVASRVAKNIVAPLIQLSLIILLKWIYIGKFIPRSGQDFLNPSYRFKYWLMSKLVGLGCIKTTAKLVGTHYEIISKIYRALGATIGKRVYWPGSGLDVVEFDLLEIGDDVVFGSRSSVMTSCADRLDRIIFMSVYVFLRLFMYIYILFYLNLSLFIHVYLFLFMDVLFDFIYSIMVVFFAHVFLFIYVYVYSFTM